MGKPDPFGSYSIPGELKHLSNRRKRNQPRFPESRRAKGEQPQVPLGLPCYDFTPVINHKVVTGLPKVSLATSFATYSHGVTGGVYKARERIHRDILIHDY